MTAALPVAAPGPPKRSPGRSVPDCGLTPFTGRLVPGASTKDGTPGGKAGGAAAAEGDSPKPPGADERSRSSKRCSDGGSPPHPGKPDRSAPFCQSGGD